MSIGMPPFYALYGYDALSFVDLVLSDNRVPASSDFVKKSQDIIRSLKDNLQHAQNQQKLYFDRKRIERSFEMRDLVFVRLQPYKKSNLKRSGAKKLKPRFYEPYKVIRKVGEVAYELELPPNRKIHNIFHVS